MFAAVSPVAAAAAAAIGFLWVGAAIAASATAVVPLLLLLRFAAAAAAAAAVAAVGSSVVCRILAVASSPWRIQRESFLGLSLMNFTSLINIMDPVNPKPFILTSLGLGESGMGDPQYQ